MTPMNGTTAVMMIITDPHLHSWVRMFIKYRKLSVHPLQVLGEFTGNKCILNSAFSPGDTSYQNLLQHLSSDWGGNNCCGQSSYGKWGISRQGSVGSLSKFFSSHPTFFLVWWTLHTTYSVGLCYFSHFLISLGSEYNKLQEKETTTTPHPD